MRPNALLWSCGCIDALGRALGHSAKVQQKSGFGPNIVKASDTEAWRWGMRRGCLGHVFDTNMLFLIVESGPRNHFN